jgi:hypothetical protein
MKNVQINVSIAGHAMPEHGMPDFSFAPGDRARISDALAAAWIASGVASPAPKRSAAAAADDTSEDTVR